MMNEKDDQSSGVKCPHCGSLLSNRALQRCATCRQPLQPPFCYTEEQRESMAKYEKAAKKSFEEWKRYDSTIGQPSC